MPVTPLTVTEAYAAQCEGATFIDVRSSIEFAEGHPAGAINVPLLEADEDNGQMMPNPDFVRVMKTNFVAGTRLLVGCRSGERSGRAAQMLEVFGFSSVTNVLGGFLAWEPAGLPINTSAPEGRGYAELLATADACEE